jgi:hypothetical protein
MRCKNCREKFIPKYMLQKYCMVNDECIKHFAEQTKLKAWNERKTKLKKEVLTIQDYLKISQQVFNKYIRLRDKGNKCISCGVKAGNYTITAGHYFPSTNKSVTFNEDNVHGQCWFNCNSSKSGNLSEYRIGLVERIGIERVEKLEIESRKTKKYTIEELKVIIKKYKDLTK